MNFEDYQNVFVFLVERLRDGGRINLESDEFIDAYYIEGNYKGMEFAIDGINKGMALSFKNGDENSQKYLVGLLGDFQNETPLLTYSIKDSKDPNKNIKVYEWTNRKERIDELSATYDIKDSTYIEGLEVLRELNKENSKTM